MAERLLVVVQVWVAGTINELLLQLGQLLPHFIQNILKKRSTQMVVVPHMHADTHARTHTHTLMVHRSALLSAEIQPSSETSETSETRATGWWLCAGVLVGLILSVCAVVEASNLLHLGSCPHPRGCSDCSTST